jgi:hypothetical protein
MGGGGGGCGASGIGGGMGGDGGGGGGSSVVVVVGEEEYFRDLANEDFYDELSESRKLWNDNLTLGLPDSASTLDGRAFVPAAAREAAESPPGGGRGRTSSEEDGRGYLGRYLRDQLTAATLAVDSLERRLAHNVDGTTPPSEGEQRTTRNHIVQVDGRRIKQGLGSAVSAISNASSYALRPLRDLQLAEKLNAMNIDMEDEETKKVIAQHNRMMEDRREMEAMMKLKKEAEESCLNATTEHLLAFVTDHPDAKYHQWIEDLHPENAHDGTLLEGMGKTIDHRFFVEESDHRRIWNDNLRTALLEDPDRRSTRDFVPARARQMDENGESVVAADLLSGSSTVGSRDQIPAIIPPRGEFGKSDGKSSDLIQFDW